MGRKGFSTELASQHGLTTDQRPRTQEEIRNVEDALASDLAKLSFEHKEKLVFDIHGISVENDERESEENLQDTMKAVEDEIRKIDVEKRSAYERAKYFNPEYIQELQLQFLRCNDYDPSLAADQIVQNFQTKCEVFGDDEILGRPVLQSDLSDGAIMILKTGLCQPLPTRDAAGRIVLVATVKGASSNDMQMKDVQQFTHYFFQSISLEEGVAKDGYVLINYNLDSPDCLDLDKLQPAYDNFWDGSPAKMVVEHFCYNIPELEKSIALTAILQHESYRHRFRCHYGTHQEVMFKLQTYGIPTEDFPMKPGENDQYTIELKWYHEWLASLRKRESSVAATKSYLVPRRFDVLFGRGLEKRVHTGNLRAVHLVEMQYEEYEKANKQEKTAIATGIVKKIHESFGRFLKWEEGGWVEVDFDTSRYKVAHFFRRRRLQKTDDS